MLSLREIVKTYTSGDSEVHALRGVSIDFRESEFVSILGPSGCGKLRSVASALLFVPPAPRSRTPLCVRSLVCV